ncbi:Cyclic di-GMP phosphodiesterase response regulator RpfG [compost metagenome]
MREMFEWMRKDKPIPIEQMNGTIIPAIYQAADFPSLHSVMSGLQAKDDYTYRHNIGVGVIATLIGKWLHVDEEDLSMLSMAALLHDIGKIRITDEILNKPGKFTDDEYQEMKNHTLYGYDIIKQTPNISNRLALVALQHHEREDGRGYPFGIRSHQIDYFSKIVGVADIFHAMTSKRVYKEATPFYIVIKQMQEDSFGQLDQSICNLFIRRLMEMAVGDEVILTDNRRGVIVSVNPFDIIKPLIRIGNDFVDLNLEGDLHIHSIAG